MTNLDVAVCLSHRFCPVTAAVAAVKNRFQMRNSGKEQLLVKQLVENLVLLDQSLLLLLVAQLAILENLERTIQNHRLQFSTLLIPAA